MLSDTRRIVLDVDAGIDDIYAILIFLHAEKFKKIKIEAIMLSGGNTVLHNVCKNVVRILELMNRTDIPVYMGAREALIPLEVPITPTHYGKDGFADLDHNNEPNTGIIRSESATLAMQTIVMRNPGEITLVCLAPLTNVALAFKLYHDFHANVQDIFIMGGNYTGIGNITSAAEYNFYLDPEAAHIVLQSATCPVTILPYEPCIGTNIDINWRFDVLANVNTPHMELLNKAERKQYSTKKIRKHMWYPCDAFLAAAIVEPEEIIAHNNEYHATVELHGHLTRGQMLLDHLQKNKPNVTIIEKINEEFFMNFMLNVMSD